MLTVLIVTVVLAVISTTAHARQSSSGVLLADAAPSFKHFTAQQRLEMYARLIGRLSESMVRWIGQATGYATDDVLARPPSLLFVSAPSIVDLGHGRLRIEPGMRGAYQQSSDTILLVLPWRIASPLDQSVLLHELAHVVLVREGEWQCYNETEWYAYELQQRWLAERGIDIQLDWLAIGAASRCKPTDRTPDTIAPLINEPRNRFHACWMPVHIR